MPQVNDLRIGRYDIRVTADAGASVTFTWPEGWEAVTWTATLGETSLTVGKDGLDVTVTITAEQATALDGRPGTWTLLGDGVPEIRGNVYPSQDGSLHGNTSAASTVIVDDVSVAVTVLGAAVAGGIQRLDQLEDVDVDGAVGGQVLLYDGQLWVPASLAAIAMSGAYTDLVDRPPRPGAIRFRTGHYAFLAPKAGAFFLESVNTCVLVPFDMDEPGELDSISINVSTGGDADSLVRLGVYTDNGDATWGDELVVDAGTVTGASTGPKTATFSPVTLDVGRYWAAVALQGSGTMPELTGSSAGPYAGGNIISLAFSAKCAYTLVSGALPSTIGAPTSPTNCPQVALTGSPLS